MNDGQQVEALPTCKRALTGTQQRACRATTMARHGMSWTLIADKLSYASPRHARRAVLTHLEPERPYVP